METSKSHCSGEDGKEVDDTKVNPIQSDYAGASLDRKSTARGCQFLGCRLISWQCKKQTVVANSTTEAEYVAASSCFNAARHNLLLMGYYCWVKVNDVEDEAVHKELGDSLVRAATTASSLEAEQDSGNITKTRSKATPNESSSLGTTLGGALRCQEAMGDTIAQTRFENVSKHSNDSLLARGNTLRSDEDRLKLEELMALCTNLQNRVLDLEKTKTTQHNENASLKKEDEEITLVSVQDDDDKEMFDVDALNGEEVFVARKNENVVEEVVDAAQVSTTATTVTITTEEITLAPALEALKTSKPKVKGIFFKSQVNLQQQQQQFHLRT
ncbi:hypothetical protein Tco_1244492 [Tanacetum coccineum]